MEQYYTGNNNVTRHLNPPYHLSNLDELNILADLMEKRLGLSYTTQLINCHRHRNSFDVVCRYTVNLAFLRLQPKITRIQKIQQGTKNEGKRKESRQRQTKQWLIMLNWLPEDKEYVHIKISKKRYTEEKITTRLISPSPYCLLNTKVKRWK